MPTPTGDLQSKINRSIRAFLIANAAGVTVDNCIAAPAAFDRNIATTGQFTGIETGDGDDNSDFGPGNVHFPHILITLEDTSVVVPGQATNIPRDNANAHMTAVFNAMNQSNDMATLFYTAQQITLAGRALAVGDPTNDADMADFTMLYLWAGMTGSAKQSPDGTFWRRELTFSCVACNSALPN